jgi:ABC-type nickel/cobalt efflux system permease component RcnA
VERARREVGAHVIRWVAIVGALGAIVAALALPAAAHAHPLGNFTINRSAALEVSGNRLYVSYVLDLAEIPTFQDRQSGTGRAAYLHMIERGLHVEVDGRRVRLAPLAQRLAHPQGQGGLRTTRFEVVLRGPVLRASETVRLRDTTYAGRIGWKEVVVAAGHGATVVSSTAPATSRSDRLRTYPKDLLHSPLDVTEATATLAAGPAGGPAPALSSESSLQAPDRIADHGFTRLISRGRLSVGIVLISLLIAAFWGAVHALTPGHGKALVAGYLVGTKGRPRDAVLLGATVTVTHTAGVFGLGLVTLLLSQFIVPDTLYPWLTLVSGVLVVGVGLSVLVQRLRRGGWHDHHHHGDATEHHVHGSHRHHQHGRVHAHEQFAAERPWRELGVLQIQGGAAALAGSVPARIPVDRRHDDALTSRGIVGVGVAAGILPCPSALVVLLSAIALHRVGFGIVLILAFSLGLAATITGIGLVAVLARRTFSRASLDGRLVRVLPAVSAFVILCVGLVLTARAIPGVL